MDLELIAALTVPIISLLFRQLFEYLKARKKSSQSRTIKLNITSKSGKTAEVDLPADMSPEKIEILIHSLENELEIKNKSTRNLNSKDYKYR